MQPNKLSGIIKHSKQQLLFFWQKKPWLNTNFKYLNLNKLITLDPLCVAAACVSAFLWDAGRGDEGLGAEWDL